MSSMNFSSFSSKEKKKIMKDVIKRTNAEQKALMDKYKKLQQAESSDHPKA